MSQNISDELQSLSSSEDGVSKGRHAAPQHLPPHKIVHPLIAPCDDHHSSAEHKHHAFLKLKSCRRYDSSLSLLARLLGIDAPASHAGFTPHTQWNRQQQWPTINSACMQQQHTFCDSLQGQQSNQQLPLATQCTCTVHSLHAFPKHELVVFVCKAALWALQKLTCRMQLLWRQSQSLATRGQLQQWPQL